MIDYSAIPEDSRMQLVSTLYEYARRAFQNPDYQKAYEEWVKERREKGNV